MIMSLDLAILFASAGSFLFFFILQVIVLRIVHEDAVLRWIINIFCVASIGHFALLALFFSVSSPEYPGGLIFMTAISYVLFGMMAFVYILCVFGPSETSIRVRVVRELYDIKGAKMTHDALLKRYNGEAILKRRIQRLQLAGEISLENGKYFIKNKSNAFFLIDAVAGILQKILRKP